MPNGLPSSVQEAGSSMSPSGISTSAPASRAAAICRIMKSAVDRRLVDVAGAGQLGRPVAHVVHPDVVGVAVVAVPVVGASATVGALLAQDRGQAAGGLVEVGLEERRRIVVLGPARACRSRGSPATATRATPSTSAERSVSARRRASERLAGARSSGTSPYSPPVGAPPGPPGDRPRRPWPSCRRCVIDSSSGWAWKQTRVAIRLTSPLRSRRACRSRRRLDAPVGQHLTCVLAGVGRRALRSRPRCG